MFRFIFLLTSCVLLLHLAGCGGGSSSASSSSGNNVLGFALAGTVRVASSVARDNDVNDPNAPLLPANDSVNTPQAIANPIILGGYANQPNSGRSGRSFAAGDMNDVYVADLRAEQVIILFLSEVSNNGDLDLLLLDSRGTVVNASAGQGNVETLIVPASGRYFIQVQALRGAASYILTLSQSISSQAHNGSAPQLLDNFVAGEAVVQWYPEQLSLKTLDILNTLQLKTESVDTSRGMLYRFDTTGLQAQSSRAALNFATPELAEKYATLLALKQLQAQPEVKSAEPNYIFQAQLVPNDAYFRYQWNANMIELPQAWDFTLGSADVVVAVIDSGVLLNHPDLRGKLTAGYDFIVDTRISLDGNGIDSNPDDPGDQSIGGSTFHGSHVAGTIGANTNNRDGVAGVGWNTRVMPLRVLGKGGAGRDYDIEQAIRFAAGLPNDSRTVPTKRADIINLSLGGASITSSFRQAIEEAIAGGVIVVAASGNDGRNLQIFPAALPNVFSVGAVNINRARASYSNFGSTVDVAAPGGDDTPDVNGDGVPDGIVSTVGEETSRGIQFGVATSNGTSMASPHVAGVFALMKAVNPRLTTGQLESLLTSGRITDDLGTAGRDDQFGHGLINARKAVLAATEAQTGATPTVNAQLVASLQSLNFGLTTTDTTLTLKNGGGGTLRVQAIANDGENFLSINAIRTDSNGLGDYRVSVDRSRLSAGTFNATLTIVSNANTLRIPVILQVPARNVTTAGDAGFHYILLVNPETFEAIQEVRLPAVNGGYIYRFDNVQRGNYYIFAGSDFDNDGLICDIAEACGAYLIVDRPSLVEANAGFSGLDFPTGFNVNFVTQSLGSLEEVGITQGIRRLSAVRGVK